MLSLITKGGPIMIPIILCSIIALAIIIERIFHLYRAKIDTKDFMDKVSALLKRNKIVDPIEMF